MFEKFNIQFGKFQDITLFILICCHNQSWEDVALFIFGNSINDIGTNNYINTTTNFRANFPPYGKTFFRYPIGRFSDGRLIVDFITKYANLPLIPPNLQMKDDEFKGGANFASARAGALVDTSEGFVVDLKMQLKQREQLEKKLRKEIGSEKAERLIKEGVYLISIGSNDYLMPLFFNPALFQSISVEDYVGMVIGNITSVLKERNEQEFHDPAALQKVLSSLGRFLLTL
ncbi:hypothetical protein BT93_D0280 [Corymbia citriodora subsp. variegata]|nr:hypothetical protein BT93_D0280 [Corymbia citriodora subsp. variegata]